MKFKQKFCLIFLLLLSFFISNNSLNSKILWADKVLNFSSEKSSNVNSASQILGYPSVLPGFGESPCAWSPLEEWSKDDEWITVSFKEEIVLKQLLILENSNPGTIKQIIGYNNAKEEFKLFTTNDFPFIEDGYRNFNLKFEKNQSAISAIKIILKTTSVPGYNQIDAVAISDDINEEISIKIKTIDNDLVKTKIENLGLNVNSEYKELAPIIAYDGSKIVFTRFKHPDNLGNEKKQDIWFSLIDSLGQFQKAQNIGEPINNNWTNYAISLSTTGNELLVGNLYNQDGSSGGIGISESFYNGKTWSLPKQVKINDYNPNTEATAQSYNIASNGKVMMIGAETENTFGESDLYVSFLQANDQWSKPINIGNIVNTAANETSPFLAADGVTLYFSSNGRPGYGENDLFMSKRLDSTWLNWSEPVNLGPSINTSGWDAFFTIPASGDYAYFVTTKDSYGLEDIFRILLPENMRPLPVIMVSGIVKNSKTNLPLDAKIIFESLTTGKEIGIARSNPMTGEFKIILPGGDKYGFLGQAEGFVAVNENLDLTQIKFYKEIHKDLILVPIEKGQTVRINNIFFEFKDFSLLPESFPELNRIVDFLYKNPNVNIEIQGHTDNIGTNDRNLALSKKRAETVEDYLLSKGIEQRRLKSVGFGKSKPLVSNDSEEGRMQNRRVEFLIVN